MRRRRPTRARRAPLPAAPAPLGVLAALVGALAACAPAPVGELPTTAVVVGTCKDKTTAEEVVGVSDSSPAVPCTSPHTVETYALGALADEVARLGPQRPAPEVLLNAPGETCPLAPLRPYLGAGELDSQWGLGVFAKFPTRAEWEDGVRTVLCDLVVEAPPGTVPRIDVPLRDVMRYTDSARVRLCRSGERLHTCDQPHDAERAGDVPAGPPAPERTAACEQRGHEYTGTPPAEPGAATGWRADVVVRDGQAQCWLAAVDGPVTGTLRTGLVPR
ncbi:septum formation family protein [Kineococcus terrestris]|uniref:septum formation family protein n=1 Tax=Kineococcus terrestris TaxID=2044856 RepID=UPI0034DAE5B8